MYAKEPRPLVISCLDLFTPFRKLANICQISIFSCPYSRPRLFGHRAADRRRFEAFSKRRDHVQRGGLDQGRRGPDAVSLLLQNDRGEQTIQVRSPEDKYFDDMGVLGFIWMLGKRKNNKGCLGFGMMHKGAKWEYLEVISSGCQTDFAFKAFFSLMEVTAF